MEVVVVQAAVPIKVGATAMAVGAALVLRASDQMVLLESIRLAHKEAAEVLVVAQEALQRQRQEALVGHMAAEVERVVVMAPLLVEVVGVVLLPSAGEQTTSTQARKPTSKVSPLQVQVQSRCRLTSLATSSSFLPSVMATRLNRPSRLGSRLSPTLPEQTVVLERWATRLRRQVLKRLEHGPMPAPSWRS